ncbi:MAG: bifunctional [glutamate--ammonia ligase]-adenylyl-L-tyrosine phosphorylase/[glutamate--ammonia-ligase] adenylyltransferase [Candidatus Hydrogenedentota bacterium]
MHTVFDAIPFTDPDQAEKILERLLEPARPGLEENLGQSLAECPDPSAALLRLDRYLEAAVNPRTVLELMGMAPRFARLVVTIFSQSQFLTDIVCRNPEYMLWLWEEAELENARPREAMCAEIREQIAAFDSFESQCRCLRRFKRREILRIAVRDLFEHASVASVTEDLANLAEAALEAAVDRGRHRLTERFGEPMEGDGETPARFTVLGMGKLGGRELNFSSDIDLVFIFSAGGETTGGTSKSVSNHEYFQKLGEWIAKALSDNTSEGVVFRVDMRLRPHGRMAPLAVSLDGAMFYYENQGQAWERQALIKARPVAGDHELGSAFIEQTRPFAFPRYFDDETLEEIRNTKQQMEDLVRQRGQSETEVKLGRGGIRDIEFTVQMLQLLNGGRIPALRTPNTLEAIHQLGLHDIVRPFEADTLARNYAFLRRVEHRLQIEGSQQIHALPSDEKQLGAFARRMGYESGQHFMAEYRERAAMTRRVLEQFLAAKGSGDLWVMDLLNPQGEGEAGLERLSAMGFGDPAKVRDELQQLYQGPREDPHTLHTRQSFAAVAPGVIKALAECIDPDGALLRLSQLIRNIKAPNALYDLLRTTPKLTTYLVTLLANSQYLTEILTRDPGLFETFGYNGALDHPATREHLKKQLVSLLHAFKPEAAPYRLKDGEMLRIGMRDLFTGADITEICAELTLLAEVILAHMLDKAREAAVRRFGEAEGGFAILGLGKMGGREIGYGSDLDVIFVYDGDASPPENVSPAEYYTYLASQLGRMLKESTPHGSLYELDARLRPEGSSGPLVVSHGRFESYYRHEAHPWERLALMKARTVAGDSPFAERMGELASAIAFAQPLDAASLAHIEDIRQKIAGSAKPFDLKKQEGGIVELEFAVRLLQLRHAGEDPALQRADVTGALDRLRERGDLDEADADTLSSAYKLYRRIENRIRMMHGRPGSALPEDENAQRDLARRLGLEGDLPAIVHAEQANVRAIYQRILEQLQQEAG